MMLTISSHHAMAAVPNIIGGWDCKGAGFEVAYFPDSTFVFHAIVVDQGLDFFVAGRYALHGQRLSRTDSATRWLKAPFAISPRWEVSTKGTTTASSNFRTFEYEVSSATESQLVLRQIRMLNWDGNDPIDIRKRPPMICDRAAHVYPQFEIARMGIPTSLLAQYGGREATRLPATAVTPAKGQDAIQGEYANTTLSDLPRIGKDESYASVRKKMIGAGWTPFHAKDAEKCGQGDARCVGRPEMIMCAGTGMANCKFLWKKNEKLAAICTVGEGEPTFANMCAYP